MQVVGAAFGHLEISYALPAGDADLSAAAIMAALTNRLVARIGSRATIAGGLCGTGLAGAALAAADRKSTRLNSSHRT